jgi:hypothetical protein
VDEALERIRQSPEANPLVTPTLRRVLLRRFPYAVYYRVFPSVISVVGVVHGRRHALAATGVRPNTRLEQSTRLLADRHHLLSAVAAQAPTR